MAVGNSLIIYLDDADVAGGMSTGSKKGRGRKDESRMNQGCLPLILRGEIMDSNESLKRQIDISLNNMWEHGFECGKNQQQGWKAKYDTFKATLREIDDWANAYPVEVFPEPTKDNWKQAAEVLKANALSLDRISASNMRHVLSGIKKKVSKAIAEAEKI